MSKAKSNCEVVSVRTAWKPDGWSMSYALGSRMGVSRSAYRVTVSTVFSIDALWPNGSPHPDAAPTRAAADSPNAKYQKEIGRMEVAER
ncbi:MAG: hypothetical protein HYY94_02855 [Gemmatimonadetes bacterium]|nr:hypothetical protein [Gemmatimonadota bacterium]